MTSGSRSHTLTLDRVVGLFDGQYPRLMSQIDRDVHSPTYGSCDRNFWMYRLHDFESGIFYQTALCFAALQELATKTQFQGCRHIDPAYAEYWRSLADAVIERSLAQLAKQRFFDEYFPGERSFPATAFSCYAILKAALLIGKTGIGLRPELRRAARGLIRRGRSAASNQNVAAAAFLLLLAKAGGSEATDLEDASAKLLQPEGVLRYPEYGGFDLGYATVTLNFLACIEADGTGAVSEQLDALASTIVRYITPSGLLGGEYTSRSTTYLLPYGLVAAAYRNPVIAAQVAGVDLPAVYAKLDDRYLLHYCLPSLALTALRLADSGTPMISDRRSEGLRSVGFIDDETDFFHARRGRTSVFIALKKGGNAQVESNGQTIIDCGYRITRNGKTYSSSVQSADTRYNLSISGDDIYEIEVISRFYTFAPLVPSPLKTVVLRAIGIIGPILAGLFKKLLVTHPSFLAGVVLTRRVIIDLTGTDRLVIDDSFSGLKPGDKVAPAPPASPRLVPSARFYQVGEERAFVPSQVPVSSTRRTREVDLASNG